MILVVPQNDVDYPTVDNLHTNCFCLQSLDYKRKLPKELESYSGNIAMIFSSLVMTTNFEIIII